MYNKDLPNGWKIAKLKDFVVERKEKNKLNDELTVFSVSNKRGLVRSDDYFEGQVYSKNLKTYKKIYNKDFGYNPARINVGSISCLDNDDIGLLSPMYVIFSLKKGINIDYFKFFIKGNLFNKQVNNFTQGAVRQILNFKDLGKIQILLPPLDIQEKIAEKLKENTKLIEESEEQIKKYELIKKAMMKKLFSEGIGHSEFKDSKVGRIPKEWKLEKLKNLIDKYQYGLSYAMNEDGIGKPIVKMDNLKEGKINFNNLKFVDITDDEYEKFKLNEGDILINRTNSLELVGRSGIVEEEKGVVFASYLIRIFLKEELINNRYVNYYFANILDYIQSLSTQGVSQANVNTGSLNIIPVKLPKIKEQIKIADELDNIENLIKNQKQIKESYENIKKGLVGMVYSCSLLIK